MINSPFLARARSWFIYKAGALALTLAAIMMASCNLRENTLLPPGLDPKLYVRSNTIKVYKDHLIKSDNDDAYLYIKKENIADDMLWYGDVVRLKQVDNLTERDSLAFAQSAIALTKAYEISVERSGVKTVLDSIPGFATLYTDLNNSRGMSAAWVVQLRYKLDADLIPVGSFGQNRCSFEIDGTGEAELQNPGTGAQFVLDDRGCRVEMLHYSGARKLQMWFPEEYLAASGRAEVNILDAVPTADLNLLQAVYPGFVLNTEVLELQTQSDPGAADVPILHWELESSGKFAPEWLRISESGLHGWPQGSDTWILSEGKLISFVSAPGRYMLLSPLEAQQTLELPLDGSFSQLYFQDLWLDLRDQSVPDTRLRIEFQPSTESLVSAYFSGAPYSLLGSNQALRLQFIQSSTEIETLPDNKWLELGFRNNLGSLDNSRLFRVFRDAKSCHIDYKTLGESYDAGHFSLSGDYVYSGIAASGVYLLGNVTEGSKQQSFPFLRSDSSFQTQRGSVSWNEPSGGFSSLVLEYGAPLPAGHPWLSGQPYQLDSSLFKIWASNSARKTSPELPANTFITLNHNGALKNLVNFSPAPEYPRFVWYKSAASFAHNTFIYSGGALQISPAFPGYLINAGTQNTESASALRLYPRMLFDNYDWEYYADSGQAFSDIPVLNVSRLASIPDSHGVLSSQYQLSPIAPVYRFSVTGSPDFYANHLPYLRVRQSSRAQNLLFSIYEGDLYRIYPYMQAETDDPWHFTIQDGHVGFNLAGNALYAPVIDNNPHVSVNTVVNSAAQDHIVSLYQAQLTLPRQLIGSVVPLTSRIHLRVATDFTSPIPALNAYFLDFRNSAGTQFNPQFYSQSQYDVLPYLYVPIPDYVPGQTHRLFYRRMDGSVTEFEFVQTFSATATNEYIMAGNCAVGLIDGPGWYYVTN